MINVVNKKTHISTQFDIYIGRPSPLGNPYSVSLGREECITMYKNEFLQMMTTKKDTKHFDYQNCRNELIKIWKMHKSGTVNLVCWCAPLECHGDIIKRFLLSLPQHPRT